MHIVLSLLWEFGPQFANYQKMCNVEKMEVRVDIKMRALNFGKSRKLDGFTKKIQGVGYASQFALRFWRSERFRSLWYTYIIKQEPTKEKDIRKQMNLALL